MHSQKSASFAVLVSGSVEASEFTLLDAQGDPSAQLTTTPVFGGSDPSLVFVHKKAPSAVTPSGIAWTHDGAGTSDLLRISGPGNTTTLQSTGLQMGVNSVAGGNALASLFAQDLTSNSSAGLTVDAEDSGDAITSLTASAGGFFNGLDVAMEVAGFVGYINLIPRTETRLGGRKARMEVYRGTFAATGVVNPLVVAATAVPGCTIGAGQTFNAGDEVDISGVFDFTEIAVGAGTAVGECYVDGVALTAQALFLPNVAGGRATIGQQWTWTAPTTGVHTIDLRVRQSAAGAVYKCEQIHTTLRVRAYATK